MPAFEFEDFKISPLMGFILDYPESLPEYFRPWHDLATNMADFVDKGTMREETHKIPQLDSSRLQTYEELRLAHLQLSMISIGYAWGEGMDKGPKSIPANIAVPLCDVSDRTGLEPGASDPEFCANYTILDKDRPVVLENLKLRYKLPGGENTSNFWMLCTEIVAFGVEAVPPIRRILEATKIKDQAAVAVELRHIAKWFEELLLRSKRFGKFVEPDSFFTYVGQYAQGFNETTGYPEGILYEGVTDRPIRKTSIVSGGQTVIIPAIECVLGIEYPKEQTELKAHWRSILPLPAQKFLKFLREWPTTVKGLVSEAGPDSDLAAAYDEALKAFADFRSYHVQLATRYFILPHTRDRAARNDTSEDPLKTLVPRLKGYRDATKESKVGGGNRK